MNIRKKFNKNAEEFDGLVVEMLGITGELLEALEGLREEFKELAKVVPALFNSKALDNADKAIAKVKGEIEND